MAVCLVEQAKDQFRVGDIVLIDGRIYSTEEFDSEDSGMTNCNFEIVEISRNDQGRLYYAVKALEDSFFAIKDRVYYSRGIGMRKEKLKENIAREQRSN